VPYLQQRTEIVILARLGGGEMQHPGEQRFEIDFPHPDSLE
jgi:hypothetical protein